MRITIFEARKILTMNTYLPTATHVAVREGRVLGVGSLAQLQGWGDYDLDTRFADKVLMPGFVEGHSHAMEGGIWDYAYVGFQDRLDPDGKRWSGAASLEAVVNRLKEVEATLQDPDETLFAWGFDPIYFDGERMSTKHIDQVSSTRPILVLHSNGHLLNVNSAVLKLAGIDRSTDVHGVMKDEAGEPTGELMEMGAKYMAYRVAGNPFLGSTSERSLRRFAMSANNVGVTTATDLFANFNEESLESFAAVANDEEFPLRVMPAMNTLDLPAQEGIERVKTAMQSSTDRVIFGLCKVMTDGSIQGFTARMRWPGYFNGHANGLWNMPPEQLQQLAAEYHKAGLQLHIHTNGDEAIELMLDGLERALDEMPRTDHRHTLQHCQMASAADFRRMAKLGLCVNLFANHIYFWGDQHRDITMGPDRAERMDGCATAEKTGVPFAIHSDAPVTPLGPLFTAWCAVNRLTESGQVLGTAEKISVQSALRAITLGAAYTLKMDHLIGSIEPGKWADFAVLEDDPEAVDPVKLKDVGVWGTVVSGKAYRSAASS